MGESLPPVLLLVGAIVVGFILFCVYFIFKQLEFVLVSVNLYREMVRRQEAMVKILVDIRDNTKAFQASERGAELGENDDADEPNGEARAGMANSDESPYVCSECKGPVYAEDVKCSRCGADVQNFE